MGAAFGAMGMDNSRGACASLGGGLFVSVEGSACIVMTKKPDGSVDCGLRMDPVRQCRWCRIRLQR